jgi:hypothetical protein
VVPKTHGNKQKLQSQEPLLKAYSTDLSIDPQCNFNFVSHLSFAKDALAMHGSDHHYVVVLMIDIDARCMCLSLRRSYLIDRA